MELTPWIKEMSEVGTPLFITALLLFFLWRGFKLLEKWVNKKIDQDRSNNNTNDNESINTRLKITPEVKSVLRELLLHTHASRVFVMEFHNGTKSLGGLPFIYMSSTYESLGQNASSQMYARQRMPFALYDSLIIQLLNNEVVVVDSAKQSDEYDNIVYETLKKRGTLLLMCAKLLDEQNHPIGFLGVDYCDSETLLRNDEKVIDEIGRIVYRKAQILSTLLYAKISKEINT